jgi:hypothetical protein
MRPSRETLATEEEVGVEFVRLDRYVTVHDMLFLNDMVTSLRK